MVSYLPVLQVLPVHPAVHLQTFGRTQVPPLWQTEHTAVMSNILYEQIHIFQLRTYILLNTSIIIIIQ